MLKMIPKFLVYTTMCLMKPMPETGNLVEEYIWGEYGWEITSLVLSMCV